jgi:hypothetical protein
MDPFFPASLFSINLSTTLKQPYIKKMPAVEFRHILRCWRIYAKVDQTRAIVQVCITLEQAMARFNQSTFSSLKLEKADEKKFTAWVTQHTPQPATIIQQFLGDGFKISCSWVVDQNAFCFSVIGTDATKAHRGMVMTSWSDEFDEVAAIAAYKHYEMCGGGEWPTSEQGDRWG